MTKPLIALIGRPNVGKSTLFNALCGFNTAIIDDKPGVTRDRQIEDCEWYGKTFTLIDTGGLEPESYEDAAPLDGFAEEIAEQAAIAINDADALIFICDLQSGILPGDIEIADLLRRSRKPVFIAVNKVDRPGDPPAEFYQFYELGFENLYPISAMHKTGLGELVTALFEELGEEAFADQGEDDEDIIKVAILGKPNVGKSSLFNKMAGVERSIVSNIAGTTRDSVDTEIENEHGKYLFTDTAGMRRKAKVKEKIERFSVGRAVRAADKADVVLAVIDASEGLSEQDAKIAGIAHNSGKPCIIVANKWDIRKNYDGGRAGFHKEAMNTLSFMTYAPTICLSALTGQNIDDLFELINKVHAAAERRIATRVLNDILAEAVSMNPTPQDKGKHLRIYYMTQVAVKPPTFVFFINDRKLLHFSYERYLENQLRLNCDFDGTPIVLLFRERKRKDQDDLPGFMGKQ